MTNTIDQSQPEEVTVNPQGRVTIPAEVRRAAGLQPGETAYLHVENGAVILENRATYAARIRREVARQWTGDGSVVDELVTDRRAEAAREEDNAA